MGWNYKYEKAGWWWLFLIPIIIPLMMGIVVPLAHNHPIRFWILVVSVFIVGFFIVWNRTGTKNKKE